MLKFECKNCNKWHPLPFHVSSVEVRCPDCSQTILGADIYVTSGPLAITKEALQKNVHKYKRLVQNAEKEVEELKKRGAARGLDTTQDQGGAFAMHLRELLCGARDDTRYRVAEEMTLKYFFSGLNHVAKVVDISLTGVCLQTQDASSPKTGATIPLRFVDAGAEAVISGEVAWSGKAGLIGVRFTRLTKEQEDFIRELILKKCALETVSGAG
ncbi:MAG: PilZ domain-containing protein [Deltaproteobacteria bacterium]|nr:PilZ domain-containing protein [Deltaproteobacteria bacterium]